MAFDQDITYRVNIDDANFQSKLSQLRASLDTTVGGYGGYGGAAFGAPSFGAYGALMAPGGYMPGIRGMPGQTAGMFSGLADFGAQIRPISYTPPAIAMQPHFGMLAVQQSFMQSAFGAGGLPGLAAQGVTNAVGDLFSLRNPLNRADFLPPQISYAEYSQLSTRNFATRAGDFTSTAGLTAAGTAAGLIGGGIGAAAGGLVGGIAGGALVSSVVSGAADMMATNRAVQTQLEAGSFRFIMGGADVDPLTGRGFGRKARAGIADYIQSQELNDVRLGMSDMRQILESGMQLDMFSGTRDAEEFKTKFKGLVDSVKTIMSTLHASAQEGMEAMRGFRDMGVTDPGTMMRLTMGAEAMGRMSGRTGMEMMAIGQTGAEMFRGTGVRMQLGFESNQQNVLMIQSMLNQGAISRETVGQMGGVNAAAQQMTMSALGATQTAFGRGALMAGFDPSTGAMRPDAGATLMGGDLTGVLNRAAAMGPQAILSFQAKQEEIVGKMSPAQLQNFGVGLGVAQARIMTDALVGSDKKGTQEYQQALEDNFIAMQRRNGLSIDQAKAQLGTLKLDPTEFKQSQQAAMNGMAQQASWEDFRSTYGTKVIQNWWGRTVEQPIQRALTQIGTDMSVGLENTAIRLTGGTLYPAGVSEDMVKRGEQLVGTAGGVAAATRGGALGVVDVSGGAWQRFLGRGDTGQQLAGLLMSQGVAGQSVVTPAGAVETLSAGDVTAMRFKSVDDVQRYNKMTGQQMHVLTTGAGGATPVLAVPTEQLYEAEKQRRANEPTAADIEGATKFRASREQRIALGELRSQGAEAETGDLAARQVGEALFGKSFTWSGATGEQKEIIRTRAEGMGFPKAAQYAEVTMGRGMHGAIAGGAAVSFEEAKKAKDDAENLVGSHMRGSSKAPVPGSAAYSKMSGEQKEVFLRMLSAGTREETLALEQELIESTGGKAADIRGMASIAMKNLQEGGKYGELQNLMSKAESASYVGKEMKKEALGIAGKEGADISAGGPIGQLSQQNMKMLYDFSKQLEQQIKMLEAARTAFMSKVPK